MVTFLGLQGCAVYKQGNDTQFILDAGEFTATVVQELQTSTGKAVLRRLPNGKYQLKLYDRNRVIDLGLMNAPFVDYIAKVNDYDLISVSDDTRTCSNTHKLVQIKGYDVYSWDFNNSLGRCNLPLEFAVEGQSWKITQQVLNADRQTWTWTEGRLSTNYERFAPAPTGLNQRQASSSAPLPGGSSGRYRVPAQPPASAITTTALEKKSPFEGAGFETSEMDPQKRHRVNASTDKKKGESDISALVQEALADNPTLFKTSKTALPRISEGNYSKPAASSNTEVAPIHVQLRN